MGKRRRRGLEGLGWQAAHVSLIRFGGHLPKGEYDVDHGGHEGQAGAAELVVALAARSGATQIECKGSLQEKHVRETICTIMEGGRDAFAERYRRIAVEALGVRQR